MADITLATRPIDDARQAAIMETVTGMQGKLMRVEVQGGYWQVDFPQKPVDMNAKTWAERCMEKTFWTLVRAFKEAQANDAYNAAQMAVTRTIITLSEDIA